jgi:hypothetical protein
MTIGTSVHGNAPYVVQAISRAVQPKSLNPPIGRAVVNVFKQHLFGLDRSRPNALGGARTNFYADAARGTHFDSLPDGVLISVNQVGFRQRVLGGTITPKKAKYLTIPARAEAHGKRASEFNDLIVLRRGDHRFGEPYALARAVQTTLRVTGSATASALGVRRFSRGEETGAEVLFWLKKSVTQRRDPTAVPQTTDVYAAAFGAADRHIDNAVIRARRGLTAPDAPKGNA